MSTEQSIWTSGTKSWFKLARQGIWVSGCAEEKGFEILNEHLFEPVLRIPSSKIVFTHSDALKDWNILSNFKAIATYSIEPINFDTNQINIDALKSASHLFWSSASQFEKLSKYANNNAKHACGYGKTAKKLRNILQDQLSVFPNAEEWLKWLKV